MHLKAHRNICTALIISAILIFASPASAHRVNVFAYIEGDTIFTESYFSKKKKVHQGKVEIINTKTGKEILTGTTDDNGLFNFSIPDEIKKDHSGLTINLIASEGHKGVWHLTAEEIFPEAQPTAAITTPTPLPTVSSDTAQDVKVSSPDLTALTTQVKILSDKVETLKRLMISQQEKGPGVHEIFSGIGYILGLFGVAAFFASRKK